MELKSVKVEPYDESIKPSFKFEVEIEYTDKEQQIIGLWGWIQSDDGKFLGEVMEEIRQNKPIRSLGGKGTRSDDQIFRSATYKTTLISLLDQEALDYLERRRLSHKLGRVTFDLVLNVRVIQSNIWIAHFYGWDPEKMGLGRVGWKGQGRIVVYEYDRDYDPQGNMIGGAILCTSAVSNIVGIYEEVLTYKVEIPRDEWIAVFAPKLGLGRYFIIEIPEGDVIKEAWEYIKKAEECYRNWDSEGAYANCRKVGTLLNNIIREKFGKDSFVYKERWGRAYGRFEHLASLDLHLEDLKASKAKYSPDEVKVGRSDVEHLLIVTKALIKFAEELLKEA